MIEVVLSEDDGYFLVRLTTGTLVLVHPFSEGDRNFLPCSYGYAITIRRAQGMSLDAGCLFFDHCYPADRGYGYVGASRFRTKAGVFLYGKVRRTDWLPVDGSGDEQLFRSADSASEDENDEYDRELEENYSGSESERSSQSDMDDYYPAGEAAAEEQSDPGDYEVGALAFDFEAGDVSDLGLGV